MDSRRTLTVGQTRERGRSVSEAPGRESGVRPESPTEGGGRDFAPLSRIIRHSSVPAQVGQLATASGRPPADRRSHSNFAHIDLRNSILSYPTRRIAAKFVDFRRFFHAISGRSASDRSGQRRKRSGALTGAQAPNRARPARGLAGARRMSVQSAGTTAKETFDRLFEEHKRAELEGDRKKAARLLVTLLLALRSDISTLDVHFATQFASGSSLADFRIEAWSAACAYSFGDESAAIAMY